MSMKRSGSSHRLASPRLASIYGKAPWRHLFRRRQPHPSPLDYCKRRSMQLFMAAVFVILYAPIISLIIYSFNNSRRNIIWRGFTVDYYVKAWNNVTLIDAFTNSMVIAIIASIVSLVLGLTLALALGRFHFPFKNTVEGAATLPIVVPEICMGVAMLAFFTRIGWPTALPWPLNLSAVTLSHIVFCFPFVAVIIRMRLASLNPELEEAARDLGAGEWRILRDIHLPHLRPALIAGTLIAFTLSLDDFVITFFTSGPDTVTFPVKIYSMVRFSVTPEINAASTVLIVITLIVAALAFMVQNRMEKDTGRNH